MDVDAVVFVPNAGQRIDQVGIHAAHRAEYVSRRWRMASKDDVIVVAATTTNGLVADGEQMVLAISGPLHGYDGGTQVDAIGTERLLYFFCVHFGPAGNGLPLFSFIDKHHGDGR